MRTMTGAKQGVLLSVGCDYLTERVHRPLVNLNSFLSGIASYRVKNMLHFLSNPEWDRGKREVRLETEHF